jgi:hypothetical protein
MKRIQREQQQQQDEGQQTTGEGLSARVGRTQ